MQRNQARLRGNLFLAFLLAAALLNTPAHAQIASVERVSHGTVVSRSTNGNSQAYSVTPDGLYLAFVSEASNLVSGDTNGVQDVFVKDISGGTLTRVSVASDGTQANEFSGAPTISSDGRYVAFESDATNLVAGDTNARRDVFLHDLTTHETTRISIGTDGSTQLDADARHPSISADGRYFAFQSAATNLLAGHNDVSQIYVRDLEGAANALVRVSNIDGDTAAGDAASVSPMLDADGSRVAFESLATNLISGGTASGRSHVYLRDIALQQTLLLSRATGAAGAVGNFDSHAPSISADGTRVAFSSAATNLVAGHTLSYIDIFVRTVSTDTTVQASLSVGNETGSADSLYPSISPDGGYVAFQTGSSNFIAGDTNGVPDVYLKNLSTNALARVSVSDPGAGGQANGSSTIPGYAAVSLNAGKIVFTTQADNLVGNEYNNYTDIYTWNPSLSALNILTRVAPTFEADKESQRPSISADGKYVAYATYATNMALDSTSIGNIILWNRSSGATAWVSRAVGGAAPNAECFTPVISANGSYIAYFSGATNLVQGDTNARIDVFLYDVAEQQTSIVSRSTLGVLGNSISLAPTLSGTGRYVGFRSGSTNLIDGQTISGNQAYLRDNQTGAIQLVSKTQAGTPGDDVSNSPFVTQDGNEAIFASDAANLVAGDTNFSTDIFVKDLAGGAVERVSLKSNGSQIALGVDATGLAVSPNGRYVAFTSSDENIVSNDLNNSTDVFLRDRVTAQTICVSNGVGGSPGNGSSTDPVFSPDGLFLTFHSSSSDLVADDDNGKEDAFVYDINEGTLELVSLTAAGEQANDDTSYVAASNNRTYFAYASKATNLVDDDHNDVQDVFLASFERCPGDPLKTDPGLCGCGVPETDSDTDGIPNCVDGCPLDIDKTAPGSCGCGEVETDSDSDGTADCADDCPEDPAKAQKGACDCGNADTDSDHDGAADCVDACPADPNKTARGVCDCGNADTDADGDSTPGCVDGCPADSAKTAPGVCGCGIADADGNGNGEPDCRDPSSGLSPQKPVVKLNKKKLTAEVRMQGGFNSVSYELQVRVPKRKKASKLSSSLNVAKLKRLQKGTYRVAYRIHAGSAVTAWSATAKFTVR